MLIAKSEIRIKIGIESLWNIFVDYQSWPVWDPSITKAWLVEKESFVVGAKGNIQRKSGRVADFEVIELNSPFSYVTKTNLWFFCKLYYRHQVEVDSLDPNYCVVTDFVYLEGLLAWPFKVYFGDLLQKDTDLALSTMKKLYEPILEQT